MSRSAVVDVVRVDERAKLQLTTLKRRTGIKNWNVLCRWALCASLAEASVPADQELGPMSNVEMSWSTFGGPSADVFAAIVRARCEADGVSMEPEEVANHFRLHLHRGINYLVGDQETRTLRGLLSLALPSSDRIVADSFRVSLEDEGDAGE